MHRRAGGADGAAAARGVLQLKTKGGLRRVTVYHQSARVLLQISATLVIVTVIKQGHNQRFSHYLL